MPIYEYACRKCKRQVEVLQKMSDKPLSRCKHCGGRLERMISPVSIRFKGSGWYVTDYGSGNSSGNGKGKASEAKEKKQEKEKKETSEAKG